jgi:hypothetical protein
MTTSTIDESQRQAARIAGVFYLFTFAIVVAVNFGIDAPLTGLRKGCPSLGTKPLVGHLACRS